MNKDSRNLARNLGLIPALVIILLVIIFGVHPSVKVVEPPYLFPLLNTAFISLVSLVVAYVAVRSYLAIG